MDSCRLQRFIESAPEQKNDIKFNERRQDKMIFQVSAWVDLQSSHIRNTKEFRSDSTFEWHGCVEEEELRSLGVDLKKFSLIPHTNIRASLKFETDFFQSEEEVVQYLVRFESALSTHYGKNYQGGYYGTPFVEVDYFTVQITNPDDKRIIVADRFSMRSENPLLVSTGILTNLFYNPIVSLYNDGLRAQDPKSKFLSWFTIIEEFLEKNKTLTSKFQSRFSDDEKAKIRDFSRQFGKNRSLLTDIIRFTKLSRHEKLSTILTDIGIAAVGRGDQEIAITPSTCKMLIDDRNRLFHEGKFFDELRLYNLLFPLVTSIVELSPKLLNEQQSPVV